VSGACKNLSTRLTRNGTKKSTRTFFVPLSCRSCGFVDNLFLRFVGRRARHGRDSNEYEKAGGVRLDEIKRAKKGTKNGSNS